MADHNIGISLTFDFTRSPFVGTLRLISRAVLMALFPFAGYAYFEGWHGEFLPGFLIVGTLLSLFLWRSERLWSVTVMPFVTKRPDWVVLATKIPFWYMSGGMGYVVGQLMAKKLGLLTVYERPVIVLFGFGAQFVVVLQLIETVFHYWKKNR